MCHLNDSSKAILLDRPLDRISPDMKRLIRRGYAFDIPNPWPKGVATLSRMAASGGTGFGAEVGAPQAQSAIRQPVRTFAQAESVRAVLLRNVVEKP